MYLPKAITCSKSVWQPWAKEHQEKLPKVKPQDNTSISAPLKALNQKHPTSFFLSFLFPTIHLNFLLHRYLAPTVLFLDSVARSHLGQSLLFLHSKLKLSLHAEVRQQPSHSDLQVSSALCICPQTEDPTASFGVCFSGRKIPLCGPTVFWSLRSNTLKEMLRRK